MLRIAAIAVAAILASNAAFAGTAFDGNWKASTSKDSGNCRGGIIASPFAVTNGQVRGLEVRTKDGPLALSGTVEDNGQALVGGSDPKKATVAFIGKAQGGKISGRWMFDTYGGIDCAGNFDFEKVSAATTR